MGIKAFSREEGLLYVITLISLDYKSFQSILNKKPTQNKKEEEEHFKEEALEKKAYFLSDRIFPGLVVAKLLKELRRWILTHLAENPTKG